ncbi:MAG TPA: sulfurtransferase-like selenium metabolism protein YedF [Clostridium sp.]|jgi:selenium metabolism protein YedF|uniref:Sulfurtransferase-like selenium metabolism protein YedF n=1 Tax=Clostridium lapidicellarium TaxID=3240931 RepID=A0ABV4DU60_9CLOT|nr:sulfurtransferase-like selenium metabolism protein YedF [uncultured Clostridium sp.]NLU09275.1 sulfurtransferase-like selenium metabolism protein YedF [Clostridiales bacterium]HBC96461.1 sulfurtransferase-like selenium metabolism protein YedF [Clostridium sp.]
MEHIIDCKGLKCPQPVINTKKYFDSIKEGTATVIVDNDVAKNNLLKFAKGSGFDSAAKQKDNLYYITITKNSDSCESVDFKSKKLTIVISSNKLGVGNDELGTTLMKSYLYALTESSNLPADLIFLNGGVKLTTEGSDSLDNLKALEKKGVHIYSCGTCLDFYGLKEKLAVGEITNMYTIVEKMNSSDNTIKL